PRLNRFLVRQGVNLVNFLEQMLLDEWSFFEASSHVRLNGCFLRCGLALQDEPVARLVLATGLESLGKLTPRAHRVVTPAAALGLALAATHRVIHRVHHHAANGRADSAPATAARLAGTDVHVLDVAHLTDRPVALHMDAADFSGWELQQGEIALPV